MKKIMNTAQLGCLVLFVVSITIMILSFGSCSGHATSTSLKLVFTSPDSGFLVKKECADFLVANTLIDEELRWDIYEDNDTIGKYYKREHSGRYLVYLKGILLETKPDGTFVRGERKYGSGTYCYCLENEHDQFRKIGDSFCVTLCQTGSGYYACNLHLFKEYPVEEPLTIPSGYSYIWGLTYQTLDSWMEFKDRTTLVMHYISEEGDMMPVSDDSDDTTFGSASQKEFAVTYVYRNNRWETDEYKKFDGLPIEL